ncbi:MAG: hypothetical protein J2P54_14160 [Bradyrhizobiaceae bacterium]|nr:hypothetical protein [Bradyrhizobiaceae bacterium]
MPALAFPLKASSAVWKKIRRALKIVARAFAESRMRRVEIEIDRYHCMHAVASSPGPTTGLLARSIKDVTDSDDHTSLLKGKCHEK